MKFLSDSSSSVRYEPHLDLVSVMLNEVSYFIQKLVISYKVSVVAGEMAQLAKVLPALQVTMTCSYCHHLSVLVLNIWRSNNPFTGVALISCISDIYITIPNSSKIQLTK